MQPKNRKTSPQQQEQRYLPRKTSPQQQEQRKALLDLAATRLVKRKCIIQARLMMTFFQRSTRFSDNKEDDSLGQIPALYLAIFKKDIFFFSLFSPILDPVIRC